MAFMNVWRREAVVINKLAKFYDRIQSQLDPLYYKRHDIHWIIDIDHDGRFKGFITTAGKEGGYLEDPIPYFRRSGANPPPYLIVDKPAYVLGVGLGKFSDEKAVNRHESYADLIEECAEEILQAEIQAVKMFLRKHLDEAISELPEELRADDWITFRVEDRLVHQLKAIRMFWKEHEESRLAEQSTIKSECIICGKVKPITNRHPVEIQIGRDRVQLITANEKAFESYGLKASAIAPVCNRCALTYGRALRYLFNSDEHSQWIANVNIAFWTRKPTDFNPLTFLTDPDPNEVTRLITSPRRSQPMPEVEANDFYALVATTNQSRLIIRDWIETTISKIQKTLGDYFDLQSLVTWSGELGNPVGVYSLASSLIRDFNDLSPRVIPALLDCALKGYKLPTWLLDQAVKRAKADVDNRMTYPRAVLIKMVLNNQILRDKEVKLEPDLNPENDNPAYLCGRLLGVLEEIQRAAIPGAKATIVDRFYGTASSAPASVFGNLLRKGQNHLSKLRKTKEGAYYALQNELENIFSELAEFPKTLSLEDQGLFAMGYYQQRAASRAQAREKAKEKEASES